MYAYPISIFKEQPPKFIGDSLKLSRTPLYIHLKSSSFDHFFALPERTKCSETGCLLETRAKIYQKRQMPYYIAVKIVLESDGSSKISELDRFLDRVNKLFDLTVEQAIKRDETPFCFFYDVSLCNESQKTPPPPIAVFELLPNSHTFEQVHSKVHGLMLASMNAYTSEELVSLAFGWFEMDSDEGTQVQERSTLWLKKAIEKCGVNLIVEEVRKLKTNAPNAAKFVDFAFQVLVKEKGVDQSRFSTFTFEELLSWARAWFEKESSDKSIRFASTRLFLEQALKKAGREVSADRAKETGDKSTLDQFTKPIKAKGAEADWIRRAKSTLGIDALFGELFKWEMGEIDAIKFVVFAYQWLGEKGHANSHCRLADIYTKGRFKERAFDSVALVKPDTISASWHLKKASELGVAAATKRLAQLELTVDVPNEAGYTNTELTRAYTVPSDIVRESKKKAQKLLRVSTTQEKIEKLAGVEYLLSPPSASGNRIMRRNSTGSSLSTPTTPIGQMWAQDS